MGCNASKQPVNEQEKKPKNNEPESVGMASREQSNLSKTDTAVDKKETVVDNQNTALNETAVTDANQAEIPGSPKNE